ncbi:hypothetical protein [Fictibacillus gelatini]|uniref:hypothetical protein n=1 Tax=Fictibacillus gelatini TaxID=225985 RepID=UPI00040496D0|nr:hypothetical protein [Fictibacillus gelatini]
MSAYEEYISEKEKLDFLVERGYRIVKVTETLDGSIVEFELREKMPGNNRDKKEVLQLSNADARKYCSSIIIEQQRNPTHAK